LPARLESKRGKLEHSNPFKLVNCDEHDSLQQISNSYFGKSLYNTASPPPLTRKKTFSSILFVTVTLTAFAKRKKERHTHTHTHTEREREKEREREREEILEVFFPRI
jgi:hypothetical protein